MTEGLKVSNRRFVAKLFRLVRRERLARIRGRMH